MKASDIKKEIDAAIKSYYRARKKLIALGNDYPLLIGGNDNMIGRIGEYIAIRFLEKKGIKGIEKHQLSSNKGFDLTYNKRRVQVKMLTDENKAGKSVRLVLPWDEFILIYLDTSTMKATIGHLTKEQFKKARKEDNRRSKMPVVSLSMLGEKGLFMYGEVVHGFEFLK